MTQRIMIEGGIARFLETRVTAEVPLADLMPHLVQRLPTITPILPDGTRLIAYDPESKNGVLAVEVSPRVTTMDMHFDGGDHGAEHEDYARRDNHNHAKFKLALPYLIFAYNFSFNPTTVTERYDRVVLGQDIRFTIKDVILYWRNAPLRKPTDGLWVAKIPNLYEGGGICWGDTTADTTTLAARVDDQIKNFFIHGFTNHLGMKRPVNDVSSFTDWETQSAKNPVFWTGWEEWKTPANKTFADLSTSIQLPTVGETPTTILDLPEPPRVFGIGRAREWTATLDPRARRVIAQAIAEVLAEPEAAVILDEIIETPRPRRRRGTIPGTPVDPNA